MKTYLDEQGRIVRKPENLEDELEIKDPALAAKYEGIKNSLAVLNAYKKFLYSYPIESEMNSPQGRGINWEKYLGFIDSQEGLAGCVDTLDRMRSEGKDLTADKVIVVRSDRPFYDTLLSGNIGTAQGWLGIVESHDTTNTGHSAFFSHDGRIHKRFVLKDARELTQEELKEWALSGVYYYENPRCASCGGVDALVKKLAMSPLGAKRVSVYDKYPNIDYCILEHVLKEDEKAVANISARDAERIDITHFYGERQIEGSELIKIVNYPKDPWRYGLAFLGKDDRTIRQIYADIDPRIRRQVAAEFKKNDKLVTIDMQYGKLIKDHITPEQHHKAKNAPDEDTNKWYKKYIDEQGLEIADTTFISINAWERAGANQQSRERLLNALEGILTPYGYARTNIDFMYAHGNGPQGRIILDPTFDLEWGARLFAGELKVYRPAS